MRIQLETRGIQHHKDLDPTWNCSPRARPVAKSLGKLSPGSGYEEDYAYMFGSAFISGLCSYPATFILSIILELVHDRLNTMSKDYEVQTEHRDEMLGRTTTTGGISISPELFEQLYLAPKNRVEGQLRQTFGNPTPLGQLA